MRWPPVSTNATVGPVPLTSCELPAVGACLVTFSDRDVVVNEETPRLRWWKPQHGNFAAQISFTHRVHSRSRSTAAGPRSTAGSMASHFTS